MRTQDVELTCRECGKNYTEEGEGYDYSHHPYSYRASNGYCLFCWLVYPNPETDDSHEGQDRAAPQRLRA